MLLNIQFVLQNPFFISGLTLAVILLKVLIIIVVIKSMKYPLRVAAAAGFSLAQIGEFSFVLMQAGMNFNLIGGDFYYSFLASSIFTMILTPFLFKMNPQISHTMGSFEISSSKKNEL